MKKFKITLVSVLILFLFTTMSAQNKKFTNDANKFRTHSNELSDFRLTSNYKLQTKGSKGGNFLPEKATSFYYQSFNNSWIYNETEYVSYTSTGGKDTLLDKDTVSNTLYNRTKWTYSTGQIVSISQGYNSGSWINLYRSTEEVTDINKPSLLSSFFINNKNTYDALINTNSYTNETWKNGQWKKYNGDKYIKTFSNNVVTGLTLQKEDTATGNWINQTNILNIVWKDYSKFLLQSYSSQRWDINQWVDDFSATYQYFSVNNKDSVIETDNFYRNGNYADGKKITDVYDVMGNQVFSETDSLISSVWTVQDKYKSDFTYNTSDELTQIINYSWNSYTPNVFNKSQEILYSDYVDVTAKVNEITGLKSISSFNTYPNPANISITIKSYSGPGSNKYHLTLTNLLGQEVDNENVNITDTYKLDITSLTDGIYLLSLQNDKVNFISKVVIQK